MLERSGNPANRDYGDRNFSPAAGKPPALPEVDDLGIGLECGMSCIVLKSGKGDRLMTSKCLRILSITVLLTVVLPVFSYSKTDVKSEEQKVFRQFFEVIGAEAQYNQMLDIMVRQFQQGLASGLQRQAAKVEDAGQAEKDRVIQLFKQVLFTYVERIKTAMVAEMPFDDLVENVYYPVYSKYFHVSDLKEIITFYESPIGKKFVSMSPILIDETVSTFNRKYGVKLRELSTRIADEEFAKIKPELEKLDHKSN